MIINNTHIQGLFLYKDNIEFEKGDFIIKNNTIYICTAENPTNLENNTVLGKDPEIDTTNYNIYLGDKIISEEEYFNYIENPLKNEDKLVSSSVLSKIMNNYMFGFDEKGVINSYVLYNLNNNEIYYSSNLNGFLNANNETPTLSILESNINNGIFLISRDLPEIASMFPEIDKESNLDLSLTNIILRQYTYIDSSNNLKYRIQELLDHVNSIIIYRFAKWNMDKSLIEEISEWKNSFVNLKFKDEVQYVKNYYVNKSNELEVLKNELKNNFKYREVELTSKSPKIIIKNISSDLGENEYYIKDSNFDNSLIITLLIQSNYSNNILRNESITLNLTDIPTSGFQEYVLPSENTVKLSKIDQNSIEILSSGNIVNLYYRCKFTTTN